MTTATATTIDLEAGSGYDREFLAHILSGMLSDDCDELMGHGWEPPAADKMVIFGLHTVLDDFLDRFGRMEQIVASLRVVADERAEVLVWPFGHEELVTGMKDCVRLLHEEIAATPEDKLEDHARAIGPATAFLAELQTVGGDA